jgi:hypothetical protein
MFDIIDKIYTPTGEKLTDNEGNEYPEMVAVKGYHANTLPEFMTDKLIPFIVEPANKRRIFAGRDDTVCLCFKNEAEFKQFIENEKEMEKSK